MTSRSSAKEALALLGGGESFDVIFSGLMMPEMTGMELHAEVVRLHPKAAARMVFLTGGAFTPSATEFLDRVPNERLDKPFDPKRIRALVQEYQRRG